LGIGIPEEGILDDMLVILFEGDMAFGAGPFFDIVIGRLEFGEEDFHFAVWTFHENTRMV
jgi:hypothetical protein